jgi:phosphate transport system protein
MERHFDQELAALKEALLRMASLADESVRLALKALVERNDEAARQVDAADDVIDRLDVELDDRAIKLLALRQPTATDLRFITMAMTISGELERIADQAVNIAHRATELNREPLLKPLIDIPRMAEISRGMIREALDAFVYNKPEMARAVIARDTEVDNINRQLHRELTSFMIEDPHTITRCLNLMSVAHNLERIADHATNIAEEVIFICEGRDVRHQSNA